MTESLQNRLRPLLTTATVEQLEAIEGFLKGEPLPQQNLPSKQALASPATMGFTLTLEGDPTRGEFCIHVAPAGGASQPAVTSPHPEPEQAPGALGLRPEPGDATKAQTEELKAEMRKVLAEVIKHSTPAQPPIVQGEAERDLAVLQRLRSKRSGMKAPLYDVFVATVLEGRSQRAAAKSCDCSPSLLSKRVGELEKEFGLSLKQLQNYAKPLLEMETSVKGQRYARKKHEAPQDERGQYEEDDSQAAREDDDGCLREERQDDS